MVLMQRFSKPVQVGTVVVCPKCGHSYNPKLRLGQCPHGPLPVGPDLDKALDAFVADKPKDIMK